MLFKNSSQNSLNYNLPSRNKHILENVFRGALCLKKRMDLVYPILVGMRIIGQEYHTRDVGQ